jgi:hypothetical protein
MMETIWFKTERQLDFLERIWAKLDSDHQAIQSRVLRTLVNKLEAAINEVQRLEKRRDDHDVNTVKEKEKKDTEYKTWKYPLIKKSLDCAIDSLQKWQQIFDPTWLLILRISDRLIDTELVNVKSASTSMTEIGETASVFMMTAQTIRHSLKPGLQAQTSIFLPSEGISNSARTAIPYSTASIFQRSPKSGTYISDTVLTSPCIDPASQNRDVRDLAHRLTDTDPLRFSLLRCRGVVKVLNTSNTTASYEFVFHIPPSLQAPQSLRNVLIEAKPDISLSARFHIAQQLAQSLSYVHTYGFVHKGIRPEAVLIFGDGTSELAATALLGFERFRTAEGRTFKASDSVWEKDLYRHPRRQRLKPEDEYVMQHDIYSLGVCLLEIGLWQTLVVYDGIQNNTGAHVSRPEVADGPKRPFLLPIPDDFKESQVKKATLVKDSLINLAEHYLPSRMGDKYTEIVVSCLTCLDESNSDFSNANEFKDEDDVVIGVRYIEKVCTASSLLYCDYTTVWQD